MPTDGAHSSSKPFDSKNKSASERYFGIVMAAHDQCITFTLSLGPI